MIRFEKCAGKRLKEPPVNGGLNVRVLRQILEDKGLPKTLVVTEHTGFSKFMFFRFNGKILPYCLINNKSYSRASSAQAERSA
ncbi:hypothetical protein OOU_Y34scaffold01091g7 [Pyricularia oryzae Y34]|uniref:Uncharacterized protein n=1 Tax=Pyricularia oryzae (strain Y34) TaxID=1143189 RepID=A0AA97NLY4_PYRO3|nr:hypothetical protein OOU_Y34scaffold01091g7 [Pyricularia oryzae Y34]